MIIIHDHMIANWVRNCYKFYFHFWAHTESIDQSSRPKKPNKLEFHNAKYLLFIISDKNKPHFLCCVYNASILPIIICSNHLLGNAIVYYFCKYSTCIIFNQLTCQFSKSYFKLIYLKYSCAIVSLNTIHWSICLSMHPSFHLECYYLLVLTTHLPWRNH